MKIFKETSMGSTEKKEEKNMNFTVRNAEMKDYESVIKIMNQVRRCTSIGGRIYINRITA